MAAKSLDEKILTLVDKGSDAQTIMNKLEIKSIATLRKKIHALEQQKKEFLFVPDLFPSGNELKVKKMGLTIPRAKLEELGADLTKQYEVSLKKSGEIVLMPK